MWVAEGEGYELNALVKIKNIADSVLRQDYSQNGCIDFAGIPEGDRIYPEVSADGYKTYSEPNEAQTMDYSSSIEFSVRLEKFSEGEATDLTFITSCEGNPVNARVLLIDAEDNEMLGEVDMSCNPDCSGTYTGEIGKSYYAAAYAEGYEMVRTDPMEASRGTTFDIEICPSDLDETGGVRACTFKDGQEYNAVYELHNSYGELLWVAEGECFTFDGLMDGMEVYVIATNLGEEEIASEIMTIITGEIQDINFNGESSIVEVEVADIQVCTYDSNLNALNASVSVNDFITDQSVGTGIEGSEFGCTLFEDIPAEINDNGTLESRVVYATAELENYATYNGKASNETYEMSNETLYITIMLDGSVTVCVEAVSDLTERPVPSIISLSYESEGEPVENINTPTGRAEFSAETQDSYYFRISEEDPLLEPESEYMREFAEVASGACSQLELHQYDDSCGLGFEFFATNFTLDLNENPTVEIPFMILWDAEKVTASVEGDYGTRVHLVLENGREVNATLRQQADYIPFSIITGYTQYSPDPELMLSFGVEDGSHRMTLYLEHTEECSITRQFTVIVTNETQSITIATEPITIDLVDPDDESFCIYTRDQQGQNVEDAIVSYSIFQADGWNADVTRNVAWTEAKDCYLSSIADSYAPPEGSLPVYIKASTEEADADLEVEADITGTSELKVSIEGFSVDASDDVAQSFCIGVSSAGQAVENAQVTYAAYASDGWASDLSAGATWDSFKNCYLGSVSDSLAKTDGSFPLYARATLADREGEDETSVSVYNTDRDACETDEDCEDGYVCVDGECVPEEGNVTAISIAVHPATR